MRRIGAFPPLTREYIDGAVGLKVRAIREEFRISRAQLAADIGTDEGGLAAIEAGTRSVDAYELCKMATLFARNIYYFFDWPSADNKITDDDVPF